MRLFQHDQESSCNCSPIVGIGTATGQVLGNVVDLKIGGDPGNERGYLVVTLETVLGMRSDTTVCGAGYWNCLCELF